MSEQSLRESLYASYKNRAMMYYHIYQALREELGEKKAVEVIKRGIYNRGLEIGTAALAKYAPADMEGLKNAFLMFDPDEGRMFQMEVLRCDSRGLDIKMHRCPLLEAWQDAGLSGEETALMCEIAAIVDNGTFEGGGFEFSSDTWKPGQGSCNMRVRPKHP